jgi:hypothetical protein
MDVCAVDDESPLMCRETRLGRLERECNEILLSEMDEVRVREVRYCEGDAEIEGDSKDRGIW